MNVSKEYEIIKIKDGAALAVRDQVAAEQLLKLNVNGHHFAEFACTPDSFKALVYGHLFTEAVIRSKNDLKSLVIEQNQAEAVLASDIRSPGEAAAASANSLYLTKEDVFAAVSLYNSKSPLFLQTGGVHCCALIRGDGKSIFKEDISRHNAVDKAIGEALLRGWDFTQTFLITGGRILGSLLQKAIRAGLPIVISCSAPTHRAVELAREADITLCGFARGRRLNIYSAPKRIKI